MRGLPRNLLLHQLHAPILRATKLRTFVCDGLCLPIAASHQPACGLEIGFPMVFRKPLIVLRRRDRIVIIQSGFVFHIAIILSNVSFDSF